MFRILDILVSKIRILGSLPLTNGSGSSDLYLWLTDTEPALLVITLQDANKKIIFSQAFFLLITILLFEGTLTSLFTDKMPCRSHKIVKIKGFSYYFCLTMGGSGFESGSVPLTNGFGYKSPNTYRSYGSGTLKKKIQYVLYLNHVSAYRYLPLQIWGWRRVFWGWLCPRWRAPLASGRTPQPAHQDNFIYFVIRMIFKLVYRHGGASSSTKVWVRGTVNSDNFVSFQALIGFFLKKSFWYGRPFFFSVDVQNRGQGSGSL